MLEWITISFSRPRDPTHVLCSGKHKGQSRGFGITPEMTSEHHVQGKEILKTNFPQPVLVITSGQPESAHCCLGMTLKSQLPYTDLHTLPNKPPQP